jgi:hypothetical protein
MKLTKFAWNIPKYAFKIITLSLLVRQKNILHFQCKKGIYAFILVAIKALDDAKRTEWISECPEGLR